MAAVTPKGLLNVLGDESRQRERINSYHPVTESGLDDLLSTAGRDPFSFHHRIKGLKNGGPYATNGNHVGRDLSKKQKPDTLGREGPDPFGDRNFIGDEFQGMLMFGKDGKPAFHSLWPEGAGDRERKTLKVNIASHVPTAIDALPAKVKKALERRAGLPGQSIASQFAAIDTRFLKAIEAYAEHFEKAFGIHLDIGADKADAQVHVMGYQKARPESPHAYASFPGAMQEWEKLSPISHSPGYIMINLDKAPELSDHQVEQLVAREFGHVLGLANSHDLALFRNLSARDAITLSAMSYSDLAQGAPDDSTPKGFGAVDLGLRKWLPNPPPTLNNGNKTYDFSSLHQASLRANADTEVFKHTRLLPAIPIAAHGEGNVLRGTEGDDFIDTNPGYLSRIQLPESNLKQNLALVEGHISEVFCRQGNNTVIVSAEGEQTIHSGTGHTDVRVLYPQVNGEKVINAEGEVTLTVTASFLKNAPEFKASRQAGDMILSAGEGSLRLQDQGEGRGVTHIRVISERGHSLFEHDIRSLSAEKLQTDVLDKAVKVAQEYIPSKPDVALDRPRDWKDRVDRLKGIEESRNAR